MQGDFRLVKKQLVGAMDAVAQAGVGEHTAVYALLDTEDPSWPFEFRWVQKGGAVTRENSLINERLFESGCVDFGFREVRDENNLEGVLYKGIEEMLADPDCIGVAGLDFFDGSEKVRMARGIEAEDEEDEPDSLRFALFAKGVQGNVVDGEPAQELDYEDVPRVLGLIFKFTAATEEGPATLVAFQRTQRMWIQKKSSYLLFNREGGMEAFSDRSLKLGNSFDFIIFDGLVCFRSLKTLEGLFGFRRLMQEHAREYAEALDHLVAGSEKLEERISQSPTVAAKLLKIQRQESPVVDMAPQELEYRVKRIAAYSSKINFAEDSRVMLVTNGNVNDFLRLLGDDVLVSPLTDARYLSRSKRRLDHEEPSE